MWKEWWSLPRSQPLPHSLSFLYFAPNNEKGVKLSDLKNYPEKKTVADAINGMKRSKRRYLLICKFWSIYYAVMDLIHSLSVSLEVLMKYLIKDLRVEVTSLWVWCTYRPTDKGLEITDLVQWGNLLHFKNCSKSSNSHSS